MFQTTNQNVLSTEQKKLSPRNFHQLALEVHGLADHLRHVADGHLVLLAHAEDDGLNLLVVTQHLLTLRRGEATDMGST